jgi:hypothetical protein
MSETPDTTNEDAGFVKDMKLPEADTVQPGLPKPVNTPVAVRAGTLKAVYPEPPALLVEPTAAPEAQ